MPLIKERLVRLGDVDALIGFAWEPDTSSPAGTVPSCSRRRRAAPRTPGGRSRCARTTLLASLDDADFSADVLEQRCRAAADAAGMKAGDFFSPIRVAVTGRTVSPPLFASLELLGRERSLARIDDAIGKLAAVPAA